MSKKIIFLTAVFLITFGCLIYNFKKIEKSEALTEPNVSGFAWSENIGWISFNCNSKVDTNGDGIEDQDMKVCKAGDSKEYQICNDGFSEKIDCDVPGNCVGACSVKNYGVTVNTTTGDFSGYAWAEHIGVISFNRADTNKPPSPPFKTGGGPIAKLDLAPGGDCGGAGQVCGWARAISVCPSLPCNTADNAGGWDGWIKLRKYSTDGGADYGVRLDTTVTPKEFMGFAWGGGGTDTTNAVVGWISFNHLNCDPDRDGNPDNDGIPGCVGSSPSIPGYKVTFMSSNDPPDKPTTSFVLDPCASTMVAKGTSLTINWVYFDKNGDAQESYEIWIDDNKNFPGDKFNNKVFNSFSRGYTVDLTQDDESDNWPTSQKKLAWPGNWGQTYYYKVGVTDVGSHVTSWSVVDLGVINPSGQCNLDPVNPELGDQGCFVMPSHAYPRVDFKWCSEKPTVYHETIFCSVTDSGNCDGSDCQPPSSETECYDSAELPKLCSSWLWDFTADAVPDTSSLSNPTSIFINEGSKDVTLKVTDTNGLFCTKFKTIPVEMPLPLPDWREIPPF
jgi:hypothetical protein